MFAYRILNNVTASKVKPNVVTNGQMYHINIKSI
jgi:hypothetical protein